MKIVIAGGGTGGHVFPAIAIAKALKRAEPSVELLFVGAKGKIEMEKVPAEGFQIIGLRITGFKRSLSLSNVLFPFRLLFSIMKSMQILMRFKPDAVVGVGGFASGPIMRAASWLGIPVYIQEQNSFPGVTNRLMAKRARKVFVAYPDIHQWFDSQKTVLSGNPVRKNILNAENQKESALDFFGLERGKKVIFVVGGSQGAFSINKAVMHCIESGMSNNISWLWQTGKAFYPTAEEFITRTGLSNVRVFSFIDRMDLAYAAADIIVSRAGAIAISELCILGKPVILIPFPFAAANHQMHNAKRIEQAGGAMVLQDHEANDKLCDTVKHLISQPQLMHEMGEKIRSLAIPDADDRIARAILDDLLTLKKE